MVCTLNWRFEDLQKKATLNRLPLLVRIAKTILSTQGLALSLDVI